MNCEKNRRNELNKHSFKSIDRDCSFVPNQLTEKPELTAGRERLSDVSGGDKISRQLVEPKKKSDEQRRRKRQRATHLFR